MESIAGRLLHLKPYGFHGHHYSTRKLMEDVSVGGRGDTNPVGLGLRNYGWLLMS
jgi:hypothetical protein